MVYNVYASDDPSYYSDHDCDPDIDHDHDPLPDWLDDPSPSALAAGVHRGLPLRDDILDEPIPYVLANPERVSNGCMIYRVNRQAGAVLSPEDEVAHRLRRYRAIQDSEGLTIEDERSIARAQGEAWREYIAACKAAGVTPESMDSPNLGRY